MGKLTGVGASDLGEFYLVGRADGTLAGYNGALKGSKGMTRSCRCPSSFGGKAR